MTALQYIAAGLLIGMAWEFLPELARWFGESWPKVGAARAPAHFSAPGGTAIAGALQVHQLLQLYPSDPVKDQRRMDTNDAAFTLALQGDGAALRYLGARGGMLGTVIVPPIPGVTEGGAVGSWASQRAQRHARSMYEVLSAAPRRLDQITAWQLLQ